MEKPRRQRFEAEAAGDRAWDLGWESDHCEKPFPSAAELELPFHIREDVKGGFRNGCHACKDTASQHADAKDYEEVAHYSSTTRCALPLLSNVRFQFQNTSDHRIR